MQLQTRSHLVGLHLPKVSRRPISLVRGDLHETEVNQALDLLAGDKTPGPDGFPSWFIS